MEKASIFLLVAVVGCGSCSEKSDEEILRERIDTSSVHLYAVAKASVASDEPEMAQARTAILGLVSVALGGHGPIGATTTATTGMNANANAPGMSASGMNASGMNALSTAARATDIIRLGRTLLSFRERGQTIVRSDEDETPPLIPALLGGDGGGSTPQINRATDHAILFLGLWVLKMHPRSPVPIPDEILLYEAWRTDASDLSMPELRTPVHGLRSWVYATNELCDFAKSEADALESSMDEDQMRRLFLSVGGDELSQQQAAAADAGLQALAHGGTAYCYFGRDEPEEAREELQRFVDAAEEAGAPPADLALVRAYLLYNEDELADARAQLELAKTAEWMDDERRAEVDELIEHLDREDTSFLDGYFDKAFFAKLAARTALREAERAGVFDAVAETETARAVRGFLEGVTRAVGGAGQAVDGVVDGAGDAVMNAEMQAGALWDRVRMGASMIAEGTMSEESVAEME